MVVGEMPFLDPPALRGNPFDLRPIERSRSHEIVARDEILIEYREHIHSRSPRMKLIVGGHGSGKSSLINVISSFTDRFYVGQYWHEEETLKKVLTEILVTFGGYEVPRTMNLTIDKLVEMLDNETGPLPLIAIDFPPTVPLSEFLSHVCPIFQRLRAFIVVSLNQSQLQSLDESVVNIFDSPFEIKPLDKNQIQQLCDKRIRKMANERWKLSAPLTESIQSISGGNVGSIIRILRDLIDEKRGLGGKGTYQRIISWSKSDLKTSEGEINEDLLLPVEEKTPLKEQNEIITQATLEKTTPEKYNNTDITEFEDYISQSTKKEHNLKEEVSEEQKIQPEEDEEERILRVNSENEEDRKITEWSKNQNIFFPDDKKLSNIDSSQKGFSGLMDRSRIVSRDMPSGDPENIPVTDSDLFPNPEKRMEKFYSKDSNINKSDIGKNNLDGIQNKYEIDDKKVFSSEGEQWTVDSEFEETLPSISEDTVIIEDEITDLEDTEIMVKSETNTNLPNRQIQNTNQIDYNHLRNLTEAEELILEIAESREISPSDQEIQARLEVGRPRLSQIYNSLYKSGILSVRKKGRTRYFKLTENAIEHISKGNLND